MTESIDCKHERFTVLFFSAGGNCMGRATKFRRADAMEQVELWIDGGNNRTARLLIEEDF